MNRRPARPTWLPTATALLAGLFLGLLIGWVLWPVEWTDALLDELRPDLRAQYLAAVADAYAASGGQEWALALERLQSLSDPQAAIQEAIRYYELSDRADRNIRIVNLRMLAELVATTSSAPGTTQAPVHSEGAPWWRWILAGLLALLGLGMATAGVLLIARRRPRPADHRSRSRPPEPTPTPAQAPTPRMPTPETAQRAPWIVSPGVTPSPAPATPGVDERNDERLSEEERLTRWRQMAQGTAHRAEWATSPTEPEEEGEEAAAASPNTEDKLEIDMDRPVGSFWEPVGRTPPSSRPRPPKGTPLYPELFPDRSARTETEDDERRDKADEDMADESTIQDGLDWDEPAFPAADNPSGSVDRPRMPPRRRSMPGTEAPGVDEMSGHSEPWERMEPSTGRSRRPFGPDRRTDSPQDLLRIPHPPGVRPDSQPPAAPSPASPPPAQVTPPGHSPAQAEPSATAPEDTPLRRVVQRFQEFTENLLGGGAESAQILLLEREVFYRRGQPDLEASYPLEMKGELLGYCGVGSPEAITNMGTPRPIHILHVWLYDTESDERVQVPLISPGLDPEQARLLDEGHDLAPDNARSDPPVEVRPGASFELTTSHLRLTGTVIEATVQPPGEAGAPLQTVHLRLQAWHRT